MHRPQDIARQAPESGSPLTNQSLGKVREQAEREHILSILQQTGGNRIQAAKILGVSRKTLWKKLKHLGVSWPSGSPGGGSE